MNYFAIGFLLSTGWYLGKIVCKIIDAFVEVIMNRLLKKINNLNRKLDSIKTVKSNHSDNSKMSIGFRY